MEFKENTWIFRPEELSKIPELPGVYLMKDKDGTVIYVGKAKNLKRRVSSYFRKNHDSRKTKNLVENIVTIDVISVGSETESLLLEATLIKKYDPHYNVMFKDNKFYPFIRVTVDEEFPRLIYTRSEKGKGRTFGPFISAISARRKVELIQRLFQLRTCRNLPKKECLNYHIHRCSAPCIGEISADDYEKQIEKALSFLEGETEKLCGRLEYEMKQAASRLEFERAQAIKEQLDAIRYDDEGQSVYLPGLRNADFISLAENLGRIVFVIVMIRGGKMTGKRSFSAENGGGEESAEVFERFLFNYVENFGGGAAELFVPEEFAEQFLSLKEIILQSHSVFLKSPENDEEKALLRIASQNAALNLSSVLSRIDAGQALTDLKEILHLDELPMRIEGFDIANIQGEHSVCGMVSFYGGKPDKKNYRKFKIKTKDTPDDFAMIHEAVLRRYRRLRDEESDFPDLILIDGGKGQLHAAMDALENLGLEISIASLAKKNEEIYLPGEKKPIVLPKNSRALHILQQVRDETHRYSNAFYNKRKSKAMLTSVLDDLPGIGEKSKEKILSYVLRKGKDFSVEGLIAQGISKERAQKVYIALKKVYNKS